MRLEHGRGSPNKKEKMTPTRCHMSGRGPNHVTLMSYHPGIFPHLFPFWAVQTANTASSQANHPAQSRHPSPRGPPPQTNHRRAYVLSTSRGFATPVATARHSPADRRPHRSKHSSNKHSSLHDIPLVSFPIHPFQPLPTMFVIKATLKDETRRLTFDTNHFPRYYEVQQKVSLT